MAKGENHFCLDNFYSYRAFHRFVQAKFAYGGPILGSSWVLLLPQLPVKNNARFKSGQMWLENNHLAA